MHYLLQKLILLTHKKGIEVYLAVSQAIKQVTLVYGLAQLFLVELFFPDLEQIM